MFSALSRGCSQVLLIVLLCAWFVPSTKLTAAGHGSQPAHASGLVYTGDLSTSFQEREIFRIDDACRVNEYFLEDPASTRPANCVLPNPPISLSGTTMTFNRKSAIVLDLAALRAASGAALGIRLSRFYRVEVVLQDTGQEHAQMAIKVLNSLWAAPAPEGVQGITVGINADPCVTKSRLFPDALYAMAFSQRSDFDPHTSGENS